MTVSTHRREEKTQEMEDRLDLALTHIKLMWPRWRIKDSLQAEFQISRKEADTDVGRAMAKLREEDDVPRADKRSKVSAYLEDIMGDANTEPRERIRAVGQYTKLHCLDETIPMVAESRDDIEVIVPNWRDEYLRRLQCGAAPSASESTTHSKN